MAKSEKSDNTEKIRAAFEKYFEGEEITLPKKLEKKGHISKGGWSITYVLTEEGGKPTLEFVSNHRLAGMSRVLIKADGTVVALDSIQDDYSYDSKIEGDKERAEAEWREHNKRVADEMQAKGLI